MDLPSAVDLASCTFRDVQLIQSWCAGPSLHDQPRVLKRQIATQGTRDPAEGENSFEAAMNPRISLSFGFSATVTCSRTQSYAGWLADWLFEGADSSVGFLED